MHRSLRMMTTTQRILTKMKIMKKSNPNLLSQRKPRAKHSRKCLAPVKNSNKRKKMIRLRLQLHLRDPALAKASMICNLHCSSSSKNY